MGRGAETQRFRIEQKSIFYYHISVVNVSIQEEGQLYVGLLYGSKWICSVSAVFHRHCLRNVSGGAFYAEGVAAGTGTGDVKGDHVEDDTQQRNLFHYPQPADSHWQPI